jgi:hypothetical protein
MTALISLTREALSLRERVAELEGMYRDMKACADRGSEWVFQRNAAEAAIASLRAELEEAKRMPGPVRNLLAFADDCGRCGHAVNAVEEIYASATGGEGDKT